MQVYGPITKRSLLYGLAFWNCEYMPFKRFTRVTIFFFFPGKSLEKNESDSAHVVWNLKILLVKFPCGCNEVINEILFEVFFYYIQHAEKLIKNWV